MNLQQRDAIYALIVEGVRRKLAQTTKARDFRPFHDAFLGKELLNIHGFVHSFSTYFCQFLLKQIAAEVARPNFDDIACQYTVGSTIDKRHYEAVNTIVRQLQAQENKVDAVTERRRILRYNTSTSNPIKPVKADLMTRKGRVLYLFDLKTVKPNKSNWLDYKRQLLTWYAVAQGQDEIDEVYPYIAIPYNPKHPAPYNMWQLAGVLDVHRTDAYQEVLVAERFWNFIGKSDTTFDELLVVFRQAGEAVHPEIIKKARGL